MPDRRWRIEPMTEAEIADLRWGGPTCQDSADRDPDLPDGIGDDGANEGLDRPIERRGGGDQR